MRRLSPSSAFTIFELVIVLVILGVILTVMLPTLSSYGDDQKIAAAAQELTSALRYARSEAIRTGSDVEVEIDSDDENFEVKNTLNPLSKTAYIVDFNSSSSMNGVDIVSVGGGSGEVTITFQPDGEPDAGTTIVLSYATHSKTVTVGDVTGRVSVQ